MRSLVVLAAVGLLCGCTAAPSPPCMGLPATTRVLTTERRVTDAGAPREMPADLRDAYTRCGAVPVADYFVDDSWGGKGSSYAYPAADMARFVDDAAAFLQLLQRNNARQGRRRGGKEAWLGQAILQHRQKFDGGDVLVFGSMTPRIEALALAAGAAVVVTSEYNELVYDHEKVRIVTPDELERHDAYAGAFHVALSISSFDHDGLGRYNDPLAPDGDLMAMDSAARALRPGGLLFLTVPVGPDVVVWNLHRRYGPVRLPLLLRGWEEVARFGWDEERLTADAPFTASYEPVFVLRKPADSEGRTTEL